MKIRKSGLMTAAINIDLSSGSAPNEFRIWHAGKNMSDDGPVYFTDRSAKLLMAQQEARGNLFSMDYDHLSLMTDRPATAGQASGWHRLDVRDGALFAVEVEFCEEARAGVEAKPPKWRYVSPAFNIDKDTREVIWYINTALCINPKTWNCAELAAHVERRQTAMKKSAQLAALKAIMDDDKSDDAMKKQASELYSAMGGDDEYKAALAAEGEEGEGEEKPKPEDEQAAVKAAAAKLTAGVTQTNAINGDQATLIMSSLQNLSKRLDERDVRDRTAEVEKLFSVRPDLTPKVRKELLALSVGGTPIKAIMAIVDGIPKTNGPVHNGATVLQATRGKRNGSAPVDDETERKLDAILGTSMASEDKPAGFGEANEGLREFHSITPTQARQRAAGGSRPIGN